MTVKFHCSERHKVTFIYQSSLSCTQFACLFCPYLFFFFFFFFFYLLSFSFFFVLQIKRKKKEHSAAQQRGLRQAAGPRGARRRLVSHPSAMRRHAGRAPAAAAAAAAAAAHAHGCLELFVCGCQGLAPGPGPPCLPGASSTNLCPGKNCNFFFPAPGCYGGRVLTPPRRQTCGGGGGGADEHLHRAGLGHRVCRAMMLSMAAFPGGGGAREPVSRVYAAAADKTRSWQKTRDLRSTVLQRRLWATAHQAFHTQPVCPAPPSPREQQLQQWAQQLLAQRQRDEEAEARRRELERQQQQQQHENELMQLLQQQWAQYVQLEHERAQQAQLDQAVADQEQALMALLLPDEPASAAGGEWLAAPPQRCHSADPWREYVTLQ